MVMKKASGGDSPLRMVLGRASRPSRSRIDDGGGLQYVLWKIDWVFRVFPSRGIYRRKGSVGRWARWPHHLVVRASGWLRHPMVWLAPSPPPSQLWAPSRIGKNRNFGFCFVQFREYFLCSFSKIQKQQKIGNWHCSISLIG
jgi:hypothetical protein